MISWTTKKKTKFKTTKVNDEINLELPLKYGQNISGHICQGHVDTAGKIIKIIIEAKIITLTKKIILDLTFLLNM